MAFEDVKPPFNDGLNGNPDLDAHQNVIIEFATGSWYTSNEYVFA